MIARIDWGMPIAAKMGQIGGGYDVESSGVGESED
jgi:hypothetical protein